MEGKAGVQGSPSKQSRAISRAAGWLSEKARFEKGQTLTNLLSTLLAGKPSQTGAAEEEQSEQFPKAGAAPLGLWECAGDAAPLGWLLYQQGFSEAPKTIR